MEREDREFHSKVREGYLAQAKEEPWRWIILDARENPQELFATLFKEFEKRKWL
jgi:thymidylate kinase